MALLPRPVADPTTTAELQVQHASLTGAFGGRIDFQFNPEKLQFTRTTSTQAASNVVAQSFDESVRASGKLAISLSGVVFAGGTCKSTVDQLLTWTVPKPAGNTGGGGGFRLPSLPSLPGFGSNGDQAASTSKSTSDAGGSAPVDYLLEQLTFCWGMQINYTVTLEKVTANYDRFAADGSPLRVAVDLTLKEFSRPKPFTNPTSGGLPGRAAHTVIGRERLAQIAQDTYGTPNAWRALAQANQLDDPLRLPPGRRLYLPGPGELTDEGARP